MSAIETMTAVLIPLIQHEQRSSWRSARRLMSAERGVGYGESPRPQADRQFALSCLYRSEGYPASRAREQGVCDDSGRCL